MDFLIFYQFRGCARHELGIFMMKKIIFLTILLLCVSTIIAQERKTITLETVSFWLGGQREYTYDRHQFEFTISERSLKIIDLDKKVKSKFDQYCGEYTINRNKVSNDGSVYFLIRNNKEYALSISKTGIGFVETKEVNNKSKMYYFNLKK